MVLVVSSKLSEGGTSDIIGLSETQLSKKPLDNWTKASIYQNIENRTHKKLSVVAKLCKLFQNFCSYQGGRFFFSLAAEFFQLVDPPAIENLEDLEHRKASASYGSERKARACSVKCAVYLNPHGLVLVAKQEDVRGLHAAQAPRLQHVTT
jgi:hypothetical protein